MVSLDFFHCHNPSSCTMALGLTQPLTEMSTRNVSWGVKRPVRRADNLTTFMCGIVLKSGSLDLLEPLGPVQACNGIALPLPFIHIHIIVTAKKFSQRIKILLCRIVKCN